MITSDCLARARWIDALTGALDLMTDLLYGDDGVTESATWGAEELADASYTCRELDAMRDALMTADREAA